MVVWFAYASYYVNASQASKPESWEFVVGLCFCLKMWIIPTLSTLNFFPPKAVKKINNLQDHTNNFKMGGLFPFSHNFFQTNHL